MKPQAAASPPVPDRAALLAACRTYLQTLEDLSGRTTLLLTAVLVCGAGLLEGCGLTLLPAVLNGLQGQATGGRIGAMLQAGLSPLGLEPGLPVLITVFLSLYGAAVLAGQYRDHQLTQIRQHFISGLRIRFYQALTAAGWRFLVSRRHADLSAALTGEIDRIGGGTHFLLRLPALLMSGLIYGGLAVMAAPLLALSAFAAGALLLLPVRRYFSRSLRLGGVTLQANRDLQRQSHDFLARLKVTKSHGSEAADQQAFARAVDAVSRQILQVQAVNGRAAVWQRLAGLGLTGLFLWSGHALFDVPLSRLLLVAFLLHRLLPLLQDVQSSVGQFLHMIPAFIDVQQQQAALQAAAEPLPPPGPAGEILPLTRGIRLLNLSYRHAPERPAVLNGVTLELPRGSLTVLAGPSGTGKSTLLDLVCGLLPPQAGQILLDDQPLIPERLGRWRQMLAYVPQETVLFHGSIADNLRMVAADATEADIQTALHQAAADFVLEWPDGVHTLVGERGARLSGGERQRLALAMALLRRPALLLLDEATSALDAATEQKVLSGLRQGDCAGMTILLVTHRPGQVQSADAYYQLKNGILVRNTGKELTQSVL